MDFNDSVDAVCAWVKKNSNWSDTLVIVTGDHETGYLWGPGTLPKTLYPVVNNGEGNLPGMVFHSGSHTNSLIPFFAKGPIASWFKHVADEKDIRRGDYLDNAELGKLLIKALRDAE
jgi:alkaline phosphatase